MTLNGLLGGLQYAKMSQKQLDAINPLKLVQGQGTGKDSVKSLRAVLSTSNFGNIDAAIFCHPVSPNATLSGTTVCTYSF